MSCSVTERVSENRAGAGGCRLRGSTNNLSTPSSKVATPSASSGAGNLRNKQCCLCWCCCCSCGCLTPGKGNDENGPTKPTNATDLLIYDGEPPPSLEEIRSWGKSFDKLMRSSAGRKVFGEFLRCEYSEENILFWLACEELKTDCNPEAVEEKARIIYEDYISILSPKEVSLDSRVREIVNRNMIEPTTHTFDEAQLQIYTLMHRDSYPRFVNSTQYKNLAQLQPSPEAEANESDGTHG